VGQFTICAVTPAQLLAAFAVDIVLRFDLTTQTLTASVVTHAGSAGSLASGDTVAVIDVELTTVTLESATLPAFTPM
jgi:hypothetical protein